MIQKKTLDRRLVQKKILQFLQMNGSKRMNSWNIPEA